MRNPSDIAGGQNPSGPARDNWKILDLLKWTTGYFSQHDIDSPRATAEILLAHALSLERIDLYLRYDQPLNAGELKTFKALIKRRISREPVAYIVGAKEFWGVDFKVGPGTLIPRPETECLVETALESLQDIVGDKTWRVLELGTGSGAVIAALAMERPGLRFFASDHSTATLARARRNSAANGLDGRIHFFAGDWFDPVRPGAGRLNMVVSNPPYIPSSIIPSLQPEIRKFEPMGALDGGEDGLKCIRRIISAGPDHIVPGGFLIIETGHDQHGAVQALAEQRAGYEKVEFFKDYSGYDRIVRLTVKH